MEMEEIDETTQKIMHRLYDGYASDGNVLFGVPYVYYVSIKAIVKATLMELKEYECE
jgi:hypothetical protein